MTWWRASRVDSFTFISSPLELTRACSTVQSAPRSVLHGAFALAIPHRFRISTSQKREVHGPNPMPYNSDIVHDMCHFKTTDNAKARGLSKTDVNDSLTWQNPFQHSVWTQEEVNSVVITHREAKTGADRVAYALVQFARR